MVRVGGRKKAKGGYRRMNDNVNRGERRQK